MLAFEEHLRYVIKMFGIDTAIKMSELGIENNDYKYDEDDYPTMNFNHNKYNYYTKLKFPEYNSNENYKYMTEQLKSELSDIGHY